MFALIFHTVRTAQMLSNEWKGAMMHRCINVYNHTVQRNGLLLYTLHPIVSCCSGDFLCAG